MWLTTFILLFLSGSISAQGEIDYSKTIPDKYVYMEKVLKDSLAVLATRDVEAIQKMLFVGFLFGGCKANYKRSTVAKMVAAIPSSVNLKISIISCVFIPNTKGHIQCMMSTPNELFGRPDAQFVYCPHERVWWSARFPFCSNASLPQQDVPDQEYFVDSIVGRSPSRLSDDSNEVVRKFLGTMKEAIDSKDSEEIGKLFVENFVFKGCQGTYSKADVVQKLSTFPSDTPIDFTLISSKWIIHGQIEYTVNISLPIIDDIEATFVYCPYKKTLKSGSIPKCAAKRFQEIY